MYAIIRPTNARICHNVTMYGQYGHVMQKEDNDWVKKWVQYEVEGPRPRGRSKTTWREVVEKDCQASKLNKQDAVDRTLIKDVC